MPNAIVFEGCPDDRADLIGQLVTVVGLQTRSKQPSVCGFDVDGDHANADRQVRVTGAVGRTVVAERPPDGLALATRGPGTYWHLARPDGQGLARPIPVGNDNPATVGAPPR